MMALNLYTTRVTLQLLGVEDYGIYNVVGGIVVLFTFISNALSTATQRYITFGLGRNDSHYLNSVFSTSVYIHLIISLVLVCLTETIGLWYLQHKMLIPIHRIDASMWVYQCSIVSAIIMLISVPYNATIIAHERMGVFAAISSLEVILKLFIALSLSFFTVDKLKVYAILLVMVQLIIRFIYTIYCRKHFHETKLQKRINIELLREIGSFSLWSVFGNAAYVSYTQGINLLLNLFCGPVINATRAIAVQVQVAVNQFVRNFQTAMNPQITKSYAAGNLDYMYNLIFASSRFSFYLLLLLTLPILLETSTILHLWLTAVPEYATIFVRLILLTTLINSIANPLIVSIKATGKIKLYEGIIGGVMLLILPISYIFLKCGYPPYSVFVIHLIIESIAQVLRITIAYRMLGFSISSYLKDVILRILYVALASLILPILLYIYLDPGLTSFVIISCISLLSTSLVIFFIGLASNERRFVINKFNEVISKFHK